MAEGLGTVPQLKKLAGQALEIKMLFIYMYIYIYIYVHMCVYIRMHMTYKRALLWPLLAYTSFQVGDSITCLVCVNPEKKCFFGCYYFVLDIHYAQTISMSQERVKGPQQAP